MLPLLLMMLLLLLLLVIRGTIGCKLSGLNELHFVHAACERGNMVRGVGQGKGLLDAGQRLELQVPLQRVQLHSTSMKLTFSHPHHGMCLQ